MGVRTDEGAAAGMRPAEAGPVAEEAAAGTGRAGPGLDAGETGDERMGELDGGAGRSGLDGIGARIPGVEGGGASPSARRRTTIGCFAPGGSGA